MTGRELARLAAALLIGAAVAFPIGMMLAGRESPVAGTAPSSSATARAAFSPKVLSDPYFLERQRQNVETLERLCRENGTMCAEAGAGRRWLAEHGGN